MLGSSMNPNFRNFALWAIIALLLIALFSMFQTAPAQTGSREIPYSQFLREVDSGRVRDVTVTGNCDGVTPPRIAFRFAQSHRLSSTIHKNSPRLVIGRVESCLWFVSLRSARCRGG